jgi:hypothetical protein
MHLYSTFSAGAGRIGSELPSEAVGAREFTHTIRWDLQQIDFYGTLFGGGAGVAVSEARVFCCVRDF